MAGTTLTTLDAILKEIYLPGIQKQFNEKKVLLAKIKKGAKADVVGKKFVIPLATSRHQGIGARAEDGSLPTAGNTTYSNMTPSMRYNYAQVRVTGQAIEAAKSDKGSFLRALDSELKGATESLQRSVNRQLCGDGSGALAKLTATANNKVQAFDDTRYMEVGQTIDISQHDDGSGTVSGTVESIGSSTSVTFVSAVNTGSLTANEASAYIGGSRNLEMMGINGIVDDRDPTDVLYGGAGAADKTGVASLQGLAVATNTFWKATRKNNSGTNRDLSISLMQDTLTDIDLNSGAGSDINMLFCRHGVFNKYGLLLVPDRRYAGNNLKFEGGFKTLEFNGIPMFFDRDCVKNTLFFLNTDVLKLYEMAPLRFADREGHVLKHDSGKDAWTAFLYWYAELGVTKRFALGKLTDITI